MTVVPGFSAGQPTSTEQAEGVIRMALSAFSIPSWFHSWFSSIFGGHTFCWPVLPGHFIGCWWHLILPISHEDAMDCISLRSSFHGSWRAKITWALVLHMPNFWVFWRISGIRTRCLLYIINLPSRPWENICVATLQPNHNKSEGSPGLCHALSVQRASLEMSCC